MGGVRGKRRDVKTVCGLVVRSQKTIVFHLWWLRGAEEGRPLNNIRIAETTDCACPNCSHGQKAIGKIFG